MAIDQQPILQLMMQLQGGGGFPISPVSGIGGGTSLSGLPLGEQGFGLGGGGSLLGGASGVGGGAEGSGLDLQRLLNQLLPGTGTIGGPSPSLLAGIGGGVGPDLGGGAGPGFGAGGFLTPQPGGVPKGTLGQAGVGGGQSAATALALLKEALGFGKALLPIGPGGASPGGGLPTIPNVSLGGSLGQSPFFGGALTPEDVSILTGTQPFGGTGLTPGDLSQLTGTTPPNLLEGIGTPGQLLSIPGPGGVPEFPAGAVGFPGPGGGTFSAGGNLLPGLPSFGSGGVPAGADLAAGFGAQGGGEFGLVNLGGGGADLLSFGNVLPGLSVLGNLGSGILGLTKGNVGGGAGTLGGTAAGLGLGAALAPETLGLSLLLGGLGGSAGGLLGSLFGGFGHPSIFDARRKNVGPTAQAGESALGNALLHGVDAISGIQSPAELLAALGVPTPDTFGSARNPVAVNLQLPPEISRQLGFPVIGPGTPTAFEFNPARLAPGSPFVMTVDMINRFLDAAKRNPSLLDFIGGSGDVAFQDQAAAEAQAARVRVDAQNAIRNFLFGSGGPGMPPRETVRDEIPPELAAKLKAFPGSRVGALPLGFTQVTDPPRLDQLDFIRVQDPPLLDPLIWNLPQIPLFQPLEKGFFPTADVGGVVKNGGI